MPRPAGGSFEPELPPPIKTGRGKGRRTERPYTAMYVGALRMGLSSRDLAEMPFGRVALMLAEWGDMNTPDGERVRRATQDDIKEILY